MGKGTNLIVFILLLFLVSSLMGKTPNSLTLSVATIHAFPRDTVTVPIDVNIPIDSSYSSVEIQVGGFQGQMEFIQVVTEGTLIGNTGWSVQTNNSDSLLSIAAAGAVSITGSGDLIKITYVVPDTAQGGLIPITIESVFFNTGTIPSQLTDGGVDVLIHGDVNLNYIVETGDGEILIDYLVNTDTLTVPQQLAANVSSDSSISALDASFIFKFVQGLIPSLPDSMVIPANGEIFMQGAQIVPGQNVDVPLFLTNPSNIFGFRLTVIYDPADLIFLDAIFPSTLDSFYLAVNAGQSGRVMLAGAATTPISPGANSLVTLQFMVDNNFSEDSTIVELTNLRWNEDVETTNVTHATLRLTTEIQHPGTSQPTRFELSQNYPNPFNPFTTIRYALPQSSQVKLAIFDINGSLVAMLVNEKQTAGWHQLIWDGRNEQGRTVASGIYLLKIEIDGRQFTAVRKMVMLK